MNFKNNSAYKKWLAYGHASGKFAKTPGNQPVSIKGKSKNVEHSNSAENENNNENMAKGGSLWDYASGGPKMMTNGGDPYGDEMSNEDITGDALKSGLQAGVKTGNPLVGLGVAAGSFAINKLNQASDRRGAMREEEMNQGIFAENQQMNSPYADPNSAFYSAADGMPVDDKKKVKPTADSDSTAAPVFKGKYYTNYNKNESQLKSKFKNAKLGVRQVLRPNRKVHGFSFQDGGNTNMADSGIPSKMGMVKNEATGLFRMMTDPLISNTIAMADGGKTITPIPAKKLVDPKKEKPKEYMIPEARVKEKQRLINLTSQKKANPTKKLRVDFPGGQGYDMR